MGSIYKIPYRGTILDRNEFRTRLEMIDVLLKEQGCVVSDRSRIQSEVDTKQSDFVAKNYQNNSYRLLDRPPSSVAHLIARVEAFNEKQVASGKTIEGLFEGLMQWAVGGNWWSENKSE